MTETQATSGAAGTSANPVDKETQGSSPPGRSAVGRATVPATESPKPDTSSEAVSKGGASAGTGSDQPGAGRSSATSPGRSPDQGDASGPSPGLPGGLAGSRAPVAGGGARYTRAPGMPPPPDAPPEGGSAEQKRAGAPGVLPPVVTASATVPMMATSLSVAPPVSAPPGHGGGRPGGFAGGRAGAGTLAPGRQVGAARVADAVRNARVRSTAAAARGPRRARLTVKRVDPWSVMKFSFAVSLVLFIVIIVATSVLYLALDAMGVFQSVNASLGDLLTSAGSTEEEGFKFTAQGVIGTAGLLGAVNVVLVTALATLGAFIYNVCADLVGGIEVTLSERA